jgi:hypothetical protein
MASKSLLLTASMYVNSDFIYGEGALGRENTRLGLWPGLKAGGDEAEGVLDIVV